MTPDRDRLIELVRKLIAGEYQSDDALGSDMAEFASGVPHPCASDLIFFWDDEFDHEPTPQEVVDRALTYRPVEL